MKQDILTGLLLDDEVSLSLGELIELVDEGILEPHGPDAAHWRFSGPSLVRALRTRRLQQDLGINLAGAALVLDLLDEIENLHARLRVLDHR